MANEQQQFESLVSQLMSPDNNIRNQAEVRKYSLFLVLSFDFFSNERNHVVGYCRGRRSRRCLAGWVSKAMCKIPVQKNVLGISKMLQLTPALRYYSVCLCSTGIVLLKNNLFHDMGTHVFLLLFCNHPCDVTCENANLR